MLIIDKISKLTRNIDTKSITLSSIDSGHGEKLFVDFVLKNQEDETLTRSLLLQQGYIKDEQTKQVGVSEDGFLKVESVLQDARELEESQGEHSRLLGTEILIDDYDTKSTVSIEGMSCTSCVGIIEENIKKMQHVCLETVRVALIPPRLTVNHSSLLDAQELVEKINEMGFIGKIVKSEKLTFPISTQNVQVLKVLIGGMTCTSCSIGITTNLLSKDGILKADINLVTGIGTIEFLSSRLGVRDIIFMIEELGYDVSIFKQNEQTKFDVETYSRDALIALFFAIPAFLLGMVFMMIIPDSEISKYFMVDVVPGLSRSDLILWVLATPVQFILGFRFYKGAWKTYKYLGSANVICTN
jgi:cation transport ATPase